MHKEAFSKIVSSLSYFIVYWMSALINSCIYIAIMPLFIVRIFLTYLCLFFRRGRPERRVYVSNIPFDFRWQELKDLFRHEGKNLKNECQLM